MSEVVPLDAVPLIEILEVFKTYRMGSVEVHALNGVDLRVASGEFVAIMGASGSGKTTLMNIIGCLDLPSSGAYFLDGVDVRRLNDNELAAIRNRKIGFVFQSFNLIPRSSAVHNVEMPLIYAGITSGRRERALNALDSVGLADRARHQPSELSGGQQQRVAIARALVTEPALMLADEPTGNLDSESTVEIMALLQELNDEGRTVVLITHENDVAAFAKRVVRLKDGLVISDERQLRRQREVMA
jgi:putative ABC transport system ATP-binding protein